MHENIVLKKAVSLTLALSFLVMSYTGIMLFLTPKGKVAFWTDWTLLGLNKTQYTDLHITSMFLFLATGIWHIYYNWKPLISYVKNAARVLTPLKKEFLIALTLNTLFVAGTLAGLPPFQNIVDLNTRIKAYWEKTYGSPPFGHAEESSLQAFSRYIGIETKSAVAQLKAQGITVESGSQTLQEIAQRNGIPVQKVSDIIRPAGAGTAKSKSPVSFLGRRSLGELAEMKQIDLDKSLRYLKDKGFDATAQSQMREAANALGMTPYDLFEALKVL